MYFIVYYYIMTVHRHSCRIISCHHRWNIWCCLNACLFQSNGSLLMRSMESVYPVCLLPICCHTPLFYINDSQLLQPASHPSVRVNYSSPSVIEKNLLVKTCFGGAVNRCNFLFPYSPFHITTCFGLYRPSSGEIYTVVFKSYVYFLEDGL
jgi:hypothetical protein